MKKIIIICILLFAVQLDAYSQFAKIDSLQRVRSFLRTIDTTWVNVTNQIGAEFIREKKYTYGYQFAFEAYRYAQQIKYPLGTADAMMTFGMFFYQDPFTRDNKAIDNYKKALEIYEKEQDKKRIAFALKTIGEYYYNLFYLKNDHYKISLEYYLRYVKVTEEIGNKLEMAEAYVILGNLYDELEEEKKSNEYFLKAVNLKQEIEDDDIDNPHLFSRAKRFYELQIEKQRIFNYALIGGLGLMALLILLMYINISQKRKSNLLLAKQKDEISRQKDDIERQSIDLKQFAEEISSQRDLLAEQHEKLLVAQAEKDKANAELQRLVEHLEEMVADRTQDLSRANEALTIANEELDILIYRASHDFKGPVATLQGLSQLGKVECNTLPIAAEYFEKIESTATKMDAMLVKLHQVSYLIGKPLEFKLIHFDETVEEVKNNLSNLIDSHKVEIQLNIEPASFFYSDSELISIVLENLLENSIYFRTQTSNIKPIIQINVRSDVSFVYLEISDNGAGIPQEYFPKIFDMFFRGSEASKGNGLGLYVVKKALERIAGEVNIESELDKFTSFKIKLPK